MFTVVFTKRAEKQKKLLKQANLEKKTKTLLNLLCENPYQNPPPYEALLGDLHGFYSRRINAQHRLVYQVLEEEKTVKILSMWTHYEFK